MEIGCQCQILASELSVNLIACISKQFGAIVHGAAQLMSLSYFVTIINRLFHIIVGLFPTVRKFMVGTNLTMVKFMEKVMSRTLMQISRIKRTRKTTLCIKDGPQIRRPSRLLKTKCIIRMDDPESLKIDSPVSVLKQ